MSKLKTNTIRHVDGSNDNITLDSSQNVTVEGNTTVDGTSTLTGNVTCSGKLLVGSTDGATYSDAAADDVIIGSTSSGKNDGLTLLSNSAQTGNIAFADQNAQTSGLVGYVHNGDYLRFHTGGAIRARLDSDGLKFGSDTAATTALDDYEEGTHTVATTSGMGGSDVSNNNPGRYTKIGRLVVFTFDITYPTTSDGGTAGVSLPIACGHSYYTGNSGYNSRQLGLGFYAGASSTSLWWTSGTTVLTNAQMSGYRVMGTIAYNTA